MLVSIGLKDLTMTVMKRLIFVDGVNAPVVFNLALSATDVSTAAVVGSKFVVSFKSHMFYAGKSTTPEEISILVKAFDEDGL